MQSNDEEKVANEVLAILDGLIFNEEQRNAALAGKEVLGKVKNADEVLEDLDVILGKLKSISAPTPIVGTIERTLGMMAKKKAAQP
jgi:hypothetical protein